MNGNFFAGVLGHVRLALFFKHDGTGLPGKPTPSFFMLLMMAALFAIARHVAFGTFPAILSVFRFAIVLAAISVIFSSARYYLISLFMCISMGIDAIAIFGSLLPRLPGPFFFLLSAWETAAFVIGIFRITKKLE